MKYRTTRRAEQDISEIFAHGAAEFGLAQAESYASGLLDLFELLANHPQMVRLRTELRPPMRLFPYRAHLVFYIEHEDGILIVRVLHRRREWEWLLS